MIVGLEKNMQRLSVYLKNYVQSRDLTPIGSQFQKYNPILNTNILTLNPIITLSITQIIIIELNDLSKPHKKTRPHTYVQVWGQIQVNRVCIISRESSSGLQFHLVHRVSRSRRHLLHHDVHHLCRSNTQSLNQPARLNDQQGFSQVDPDHHRL